MLEIIDKTNFDLSKAEEDVWFCYQPNIEIYKPDFEKAKLFSVEEVFSEITFACHRPWDRYHSDEFCRLYPEALELLKLQE